jgi:branched-chain amino acid transport system ATP-binding protein
MSLLAVSDVVAGYGPNDSILKGVGIEVAAGEIVALLGPNGAGKSTLLKAIAGAVGIRQGRIVVDGRDIANLRPREVSRGGVAYVPQEANIFPSLTIAENLEIGGFVDPRGARTRMAEIIGLMPDLARHRSARGKALSGGQRQMLAVGMALMVSPRLLLLDEPSAGLSPVATENLFKLLNEIRRGGVAILLVEQNALAALDFADRAYILVDGQVRRAGAARALAEDPEIREVFLGG